MSIEAGLEWIRNELDTIGEQYEMAEQEKNEAEEAFYKLQDKVKMLNQTIVELKRHIAKEEGGGR